MASTLISNSDIQSSLGGYGVDEITLGLYIDACDADIIGFFGPHPTAQEISSDTEKAMDASRRIRCLIRLVQIEANYKPELSLTSNAQGVVMRDYRQERKKAFETVGFLRVL